MGRNAQRRRAGRDAQVGGWPRPIAYLDVRAYLLSRGYVRSRREAAEALEAGKVSINGKTWAYPHFPRRELQYDSYGRPRIMLEGVPDPRPVR